MQAAGPAHRHEGFEKAVEVRLRSRESPLLVHVAGCVDVPGSHRDEYGVRVKSKQLRRFLAEDQIDRRPQELGSCVRCRSRSHQGKRKAMSSAGRLAPPVGTTINCLPFSR